MSQRPASVEAPQPGPSPASAARLGSTKFGHTPQQVAFWRRLTRTVLSAGGQTPFYVCASQPIQERLAGLEALSFGVPARLWLSCKTQPLAPLLRWWIRQGRPVEVVSEFEFRAALAEGCPVDQLLLNGPAKHRWLPALSQPGLQVNFDSPGELRALLPLAQRYRWRTGLRVRTPEEVDPENPRFPTQFGFEVTELPAAVQTLRRAGLEPQVLHTHLRTNLPSPVNWTQALPFLHAACVASQWFPPILDTGGGLPAPHTQSRSGRSYTAEYDPTFQSYARHLRAALKPFGWLREVWFEHGRHVSAGSGVLAVRVWDVKAKGGHPALICDGGRTLQALVSAWESHALIPLRRISGPEVSTAVHGPTCMAFDQLGHLPLPRGVRTGDVLLWLEAGAYHLPWETRFSHGLCGVWWEDEGQLTQARAPETFEEYWGRWQGGTDTPPPNPL